MAAPRWFWTAQCVPQCVVLDCRVDDALGLAPQGVDVSCNGERRNTGADGNDGQGDGVLGQVLSTLVTDQLLHESHHDTALLLRIGCCGVAPA